MALILMDYRQDFIEIPDVEGMFVKQTPTTRLFKVEIICESEREMKLVHEFITNNFRREHEDIWKLK